MANWVIGQRGETHDGVVSGGFEVADHADAERAETDDDHEWIPNPRQKGVLGVPVRQEMIDGWMRFLDESEDLLAGKKLVPFWRGAETRGVNLRKVFTDPRPFDSVLWIQGIGATPYLEDGPMTNPEVWGRLQRVFGGEFFGFAIWFN